MTDQQCADALQVLQRQLMSKAAAAGEVNKKAGEEYLAANAKKPGVKTTASGLQYKVLKEGAGKNAKDGDTVTVHYKGTLTDGTQFDSSYDRKEPYPVTIGEGQVIPGWEEALKLMKVGSKYQFTIPANLAYGERGRPPRIAPNSVLNFDLEVLGIK